MEENYEKIKFKNKEEQSVGKEKKWKESQVDTHVSKTIEILKWIDSLFDFFAIN